MTLPAMDGMSRAEIDKAEKADLAKVRLRPRDAGTLILIDQDGPEPRVLMGRRAMRHAFMPGKFVFPGGRTDPGDSRIAAATPLHDEVAAKMAAGLGARASAARCRAIAMSAVRETYEEAGLLIGRKERFVATKSGWQAFAEHGVQPSLDNLRFIARAITPPGRVRRFDTRFLAAWKSAVAVSLPGGPPTDELEELVWLPIAEAQQLDLPRITSNILADLHERIAEDPELRPGSPAPFYRMLHKRFVREIV